MNPNPTHGRIGLPDSTAQTLNRQHILDATDGVLLRQGYDGTTLRAIAKELGCAVGSIYRYFDDKRELLEALCSRPFEAVVNHIQLRVEPARSVKLYALAAAECPARYRLMFFLSGLSAENDASSDQPTDLLQNPAPPTRSATPPPLPHAIATILAGWREQLGEDEGTRLWAMLHGLLMSDLSWSQILETIGLEPPQPETLGRHPPMPYGKDAQGT